MGFVGLSTLQLGSGWLPFFMMVLSYAAFYVAQWGEYHSGKLEFGKLSVTELECLLMVHYLFTAAVGTAKTALSFFFSFFFGLPLHHYKGSSFWVTQIQFPFFTVSPNMIFGLFHTICAIGTIAYG